jgi:hypothetical protein
MTMDKRFVVYIVARYWLLVPIFRGLVRLSALYVFGLRYYFPPSSPTFFFYIIRMFGRLPFCKTEGARCFFPCRTGLDLFIGS